jgi:hypothetical protein
MTIYPVRFFIDEHFIKDIIGDKEKAAEIIQKLSKIHTTSEHYSFSHNLLLDESFKNAIADKAIRGPALLGAMRPIDCSDSVSETELDSKIIKYCINLSYQKPFNIIILTSEAKAKEYLKNEHYKKDHNIANAVKIYSGAIAVESIDLMFRIS